MDAYYKPTVLMTLVLRKYHGAIRLDACVEGLSSLTWNKKAMVKKTER